MKKITLAFLMTLSFLSNFAAASDNNNQIGWKSLPGTYTGDDGCSITIETQTKWWQPFFKITLENNEGSLEFSASIAEYKHKYTGGLSVVVKHQTGLSLGRHTTTYAELRFDELAPDAPAGTPLHLRGITLDRTLADFFLVEESQQLTCWGLVKGL